MRQKSDFGVLWTKILVSLWIWEETGLLYQLKSLKEVEQETVEAAAVAESIVEEQEAANAVNTSSKNAQNSFILFCCLKKKSRLSTLFCDAIFSPVFKFAKNAFFWKMDGLGLNIPITTFLLNGICIIEQDHTGDTIISWSYPNSDKFVPNDVILQRSSFRNPVVAQGLNLDDALQNKAFVYSKYDNYWHYSLQKSVENNPTLKAFAIVIIAKVCKQFC